MRRYKSRLLRLCGVTLVVALSLYFTYHAIYGARGLRREQTLKQEVAAKELELKKLQSERTSMERRTQGLRPDSIDPDMLEEQARKQLGYGKDGEKVILTTPR